VVPGDEAAIGMLKGVEAASGAVPLVHVDDLCRAKVLVAEEAAAAGRYICCGLDTTIVGIARFPADKYPRYSVNSEL
jgi:anthocyanidin reductase